MDIVQNSVISLINKNLKRNKDVSVPGVNTEFIKSDMKAWWDRISSGGTLNDKSTSSFQDLIFSRLHNFITGSVSSDKLINMSGLESMGFSVSFVRLIYKHVNYEYDSDKNCSNVLVNTQNQTKFNRVFLTLFLNGLAAQTPRDLVNLLAMFVEMQRQKKSDMLSKTESKSGKSVDNDSVIEDVIKKCQDNHRTNSSVLNVIATKIDDVKRDIERTILYKVPRDEIFLTTISRVILEPRYAVATFEKATRHYRFYPANMNNTNHLKAIMGGCRVNLQSDIHLMRRELFTLVLPFSFFLSNMDNAYVVNLILNVLLGYKVDVQRSFKETVQFKFIENVYSSESILENIELMVEKNKLNTSNTLPCSTFISRVWKSVSAFVTFLSLFRTIFHETKYLTVCRVDSLPASQLQIEKTRILPNCIYFHKNHYYISLCVKPNQYLNIATDSFYELFYQVYLSKCT